MGIILTPRQQEICQWYYVEHRNIREIADLLRSTYGKINLELATLRAIFASHGQELPRYNHGRPRLTPVLPAEAVI